MQNSRYLTEILSLYENFIYFICMFVYFTVQTCLLYDIFTP